MIDAATWGDIQILWDFLGRGTEDVPGRCDLAIVCGSRDLFIVEHVVGLYRLGAISNIICSGGIAHQDDLLATGWGEPEAKVFSDEIVRLGVPGDRVHLEDGATNTAENIALSLELADRRELPHAAPIVLVHKPFMALRTGLTARSVAPDRTFLVSCPRITAADYLNQCDEPDRTISIMVGDFERLIVYAMKGFSEATDIPGEVISAAQRLRDRGYTAHSLIR